MSAPLPRPRKLNVQGRMWNRRGWDENSSCKRVLKENISIQQNTTGMSSGKFLVQQIFPCADILIQHSTIESERHKTVAGHIQNTFVVNDCLLRRWPTRRVATWTCLQAAISAAPFRFSFPGGPGLSCRAASMPHPADNVLCTCSVPAREHERAWERRR
jgi:hypothetical protein